MYGPPRARSSVTDGSLPPRRPSFIAFQGGSPQRAFATACFPAEAAVKRVQAAPRHGGRDTGRVMPEESTTPDLVELARRSVEVAGEATWTRSWRSTHRMPSGTCRLWGWVRLRARRQFA